MSERITDDMAIHALAWARNYGDVEEWKKIAKRGPKWLVTLADKGTISIEGAGRITPETLEYTPAFMLPRGADIIPKQLALTNREVILFCYGLAIGGERSEPRSTYRGYWDRGEKHPTEQARQKRRDQRMRDRIADTKEKED